MAKPRCACRLYVVDRLRHLEDVQAGDLSYWCVESGGQVGDLGVIYLKGEGVTLVFEVLEQPEPDRESFCHYYGMIEAKMRVTDRFARPLTVSMMRSNRILKSLPALRRNFQRRSFRIDKTNYIDEIRRLALANSDQPGVAT